MPLGDYSDFKSALESVISIHYKALCPFEMRF